MTNAALVVGSGLIYPMIIGYGRGSITAPSPSCAQNASSMSVPIVVSVDALFQKKHCEQCGQWKKPMRNFLKETLSVVMGLLLLGAVLAAAIAPLAWMANEVSKDPTAVRKAWLRK